MKRAVVAQQGEVKVFRVTCMPDTDKMRNLTPVKGFYIISHSESGNHHVIPSGDAVVMEMTSDVPKGMRILYAIVKNPTALRQDGQEPHKPVNMDNDGPGLYEMRVSREYDPFLEEARRVAD